MGLNWPSPTRFHAGHEIADTLSDIPGITVWRFRRLQELEARHRTAPLAAVLEINLHADIHAYCRNQGLPYVAWTFDSGGALIRELPFGPSDWLFFYDRQDAAFCQTRGAQAWYLPFSGGAMFHRTPRTDAGDVPIRIVMNLYMFARTQNEQAFRATRDSLPPGLAVRHQFETLRALTDQVIRQHLDLLTRNDLAAMLTPLIARHRVTFFEGAPDKWTDFVKGLGQELAYRQRIRLVTALAACWPVEVYGDSDWADVAQAGAKIAYRGQAEYVRLPELYNGAAININLTQPQCRHSIPQRIFHVLAAGGFLLTDPNDAILEHFVPGQHLDTYATTDELRDKCAYYLAHAEPRQRIARAGHAAFLQHHTMRQRLMFLWSCLPKHLTQPGEGP